MVSSGSQHTASVKTLLVKTGIKQYSSGQHTASVKTILVKTGIKQYRVPKILAMHYLHQGNLGQSHSLLCIGNFTGHS